MLLSLVLSFNLVQGQDDNVDKQLALQYYQNGEYEKALVLLEKIYKKEKTKAYYEYILECYVFLEDFKSAEKHVKKQLNKFPGVSAYMVDMGYVFEKAEDERKSGKWYKEAVNNLKANPEEIIAIADDFMAYKNYDMALEVYEKGEKLLNGSYPFAFEKGEIYILQRKIPQVIDEYLDVLEINRGYLMQVQSALQTLLNDDKNHKRRELLKAKLLQRIQNSKNETVYSELLIWVFMLEKDFEGAFIQAKALDKRNKEDGRRLFNLAKIAVDNLQYDVAIQCYEYVISKGDESFYYLNARMKLIQTMREKLFHEGEYSEEDLLSLEKEYYQTLEEFGGSFRVVELKRDLAHFQTFYLDKADTAIALLKEAIEIPRTRKKEVALCKLELGDILVYQGKVWDAVMYYGQVETEYKHDVLGHEAKFRKAQVYYYTGDFGWAKAQLDILKASTSKLISNDALSLSLIISDNTGLDTNEAPVKMYALADLFYYQKQFGASKELLDSIVDTHPDHYDIKDDVYYLYAKIAMEQREYEQAAEYLTKMVTLNTALADDGLFELGMLYEFHLNDKEKAQDYYKTLIMTFPGSIHAVIGRKRFRYLRGDIDDPNG